MDYLDDFLLQEIFVRLPVKSVNSFKCVSNHWLSLISDTSFVHQYVQFQASRNCTNYDSDNYRSLSQATFLYMKKGAPTPSCLHFPSLASEYKGFYFRFIPARLQQEQLRINLLAASHGWILCSSHSSKFIGYVNNEISVLEPDYHLCSPLLKRWIDIPRLPKHKRKKWYDPRLVSSGEFMCDDDLISSCSSNSGFAVKSMKFKVVITIRCHYSLRVMIFSSETWEWSVSTIREPVDAASFPFYEYCVYCRPYMVSCDGVLYWISQPEVCSEPEVCMFALDLNNGGDVNPLHLHSIPLPALPADVDVACQNCVHAAQLGLCKGQVHLSLWRYCSFEGVTLTIWELIRGGVDTVDHHYQWSLKHTVTLECCSILSDCVSMVYFSPVDEDIVYLVLTSNKVVLFNLREKTKIVCGHLDKIDHSCVFFVIPYWPLALKTLSPQEKKRQYEKKKL